jgi:hypothetical protein
MLVGLGGVRVCCLFGGRYSVRIKGILVDIIRDDYCCAELEATFAIFANQFLAEMYQDVAHCTCQTYKLNLNQ